MNNKSLIFISAVCTMAAVIIYAYLHGWIIITRQLTFISSEQEAAQLSKKKVTLYYYQHETLKHETADVIWSANTQTNAFYLINSWLNLVEEEQVITKKITLQAALLNSTEKELYISFDQSPFTPQQTTHEKWLLLEALLKTIKDNDIKVQAVHFLVHHQPMQDTHLDFSNAWPVGGFTE